MSDKPIVTCALTGVLTNPKQHPVPVTVEEMAAAAREAFDAGAGHHPASTFGIGAGLGHTHLGSRGGRCDHRAAIRAACPGVIINMSTGVMGPDIGTERLHGADRARDRRLQRRHPQLSPRALERTVGLASHEVFDNPVEKVQRFLDIMAKTGAKPEFECFDVGIVRSVGMYGKAGMTDKDHAEYNFVMGVESGMPLTKELLPSSCASDPDTAPWSAPSAAPRSGSASPHRRASGHLRTGVEDTFYLPDGERCRGNGDLVETLCATPRRPAERSRLGRGPRPPALASPPPPRW